MRRQAEIFLFTSAAPSVTLFSQHADPGRQPISLLASILVHAAVSALVSFGVLYAPVSARIVTDHYDVRKLDLRTPDQQARHASNVHTSAAARQVAKALAANQHPAPAPAALHQAIHAETGSQTLLQPDLLKNFVAVEQIPVPQVMIWTPRTQPVKDIVAPHPAPPTSADTKPSLDAPNAEIQLADINLASSLVPTQKLAVMPSTTSPVAMLTASPLQLAPATTTQQTAQPTPTAVFSASDLRMKDGTAVLPPVNETMRSSTPGVLDGLSTAKDPLASGSDRSARPAGQDTQAGPAQTASGAAAPGALGTPDGAAVGAAQGSPAGDPVSTTQITLSPNGNFSAVIVGQSMEDQFPELDGVWSGRMAYTVYLHVGLARSWILQYSLPRDAEADAGGSVSRLDAPWPYSIVRPNLSAADVNADALMVHGFVDQAGRFQNLSLVFPQAWPQAPFVLKSLAQWQFRPASQNGQVARVEVLLIIPEELN